jgi:hypothetical protein
MLRKWFAAGALAAAGVLALASGARAGDVQTLKLTDKTPTLSLVGDRDDADTVDVRGHGGFHGGGFHNSFHGGGFHNSFHGGFNRGFYGFNRGFYGFNRGFYGGYRGFYGGYRGFYGGYYNPYYYSSYYYAPPVYYYSAPSYYVDPCYSLGGSYAPTVSLTIDRAPIVGRTIIETDPTTPAPPPLPRADDNYPYDGGPRQPVPMPKADPAPIATPPVTAPLEGRAVSLPLKLPKLPYPAYGESISPDDRGAVVKKAPK